MEEKTHIPLHKLQERSEIGIEILHRQQDGSKKKPHEFYVHRDDNYFFLLGERGSGSMYVDFNPVKFTEKNIYFVASGQVHYDFKLDEADYWYIAVTASLIPKDYLEVFDTIAPFQKPCNLTDNEFKQFHSTVELLAIQFFSDPDDVYYKQMTQELLQSFLCATARSFTKNNIIDNNTILRPQQISRDFKKLLKENMKSEKSPSYYAGILNISEAYLNEAVKNTTGFTAGYWIRYYIILEAKRLLFHTEMTVKEIAHFLGYENHAYFSKLFRQTAGTTPLTFRTDYLK